MIPSIRGMVYVVRIEVDIISVMYCIQSLLYVIVCMWSTSNVEWIEE